MLDTKHSRNANGELTIANSNGTVLVCRTPNEAFHARPWTLEICGHVHETYDTEVEAISAAHEILALKP